jgi:hypothetical protein
MNFYMKQIEDPEATILQAAPGIATFNQFVGQIRREKRVGLESDQVVSYFLSSCAIDSAQVGGKIYKYHGK